MKLTIEFKDPYDFQKLINLMVILEKDIMNYGFELQADFMDQKDIVDSAIRQLRDQYNEKVYGNDN